jgi:hypothetical protein
VVERKHAVPHSARRLPIVTARQPARNRPSFAAFRTARACRSGNRWRIQEFIQ